jgi:hypothetical protein
MHNMLFQTPQTAKFIEITKFVKTKKRAISMHVSRQQYKALQQQHQCCFVSLSSPGTIEPRESSSFVCDLYTSCAPWTSSEGQSI